jgi:molybdenum cofactor cytidylyltransferase
MPRVRHTDIDALIDAFERDGGRTICVPVHEGQRGNPVLWPARFFPDLLQLTGDRGARELLASYADHVSLVEMRDAGVILDVDTPQMLQALRNGCDD